MFHCGMRQVEEKHIANQVDLMVWSNRLDLLALSNFKGEVQVHRLHWQKVWNLSPPKENVKVQAMAWRPDGKALAIGYNNGMVLIVDIEDKEIIDKLSFLEECSEEFCESNDYGIPCITWTVKAGILESATEYNLYDDATIFLPKPPPSSNTYKSQSNDENTKSHKESFDQQINMLIIAYGTGYLHLRVYGRYPMGTLHLSQITKDECGEYTVLEIALSDDFSCIQILYWDRITKSIHVSLINTSALSAYCEEMYVVASKHNQIVQLLSHLDKSMVSITEAWEHILLEMDTKMAHYASSVPEGGVSADFLELLMLGNASDQLEVFLLRELTAKGLKKFGSSVELSYSTIQKLVLKQLNIVGQSLTYYFAELRGLIRVPDRYKIFELDEKLTTEAIKACYAFLNKCLELQQVIDVSMRNYKAFFRWLFIVIVRLLDEQTPSEIVKITQQELTHIADFLYNFDNIQSENNETPNPEKPVKFNLERLGQYLQDQNLTIVSNDDENIWHKFLKENSCLLKDNDTIFSMSEFKKYSLVQQHKHLKNAINQVFEAKDKDIGKYFSVLFNVKCQENNLDKGLEKLRFSQIYDASEQRFMTAFANESTTEELYFMSWSIRERACNSTAGKYFFSSSLLHDSKSDLDSNFSVLDLQFYSAEYLSVLIKNNNIPDTVIFVQLPLKIALENSTEINSKSRSLIFSDKIIRKDLATFLDSNVFKVLEKMDGFRIAVSGGRKVSVVLSNTQRKVRVFEMEINGEDDEDETLDTTPLSQGTHASESSQGTPGNKTDDNIF